jgi:DNA-binding beta-propeller fold protein YncE
MMWCLSAFSLYATVIDPKNRTVVGIVRFDGRPEFAVADGLGYVHNDLEDKSQIVTFDSRTLNIFSTWPLASEEEPTGMASDKTHHRLFAGCANNLMVIRDANGGRVIASVPIGSGVDAVAFDSELGLVFSSNRDGTLTVVKADSGDKYSVLTMYRHRKGSEEWL